jgi:hypothetical protein
LRLATQEHLKRWPCVRINLEIIHLRRDVDLKPKGCCVIGGVINDLCLCPMPRSLCQFFVLLPVTLSK